MNEIGSAGPAQWRAAIVLDTLAASWGLDAVEAAALVDTSPDIVNGWRRAESNGWSGLAEVRLRLLLRLHECLWVVCPYQSWPNWWRQRWLPGAPLGERSPIEAVMVDASTTLDLLVAHCSTLAEPTYL